MSHCRRSRQPYHVCRDSDVRQPKSRRLRMSRRKLLMNSQQRKRCVSIPRLAASCLSPDRKPSFCSTAARDDTRQRAPQRTARHGHAARDRHRNTVAPRHRFRFERSRAGPARGRERALDRRARPCRRAVERRPTSGRAFNRGVSVYPALGDRVRVAIRRSSRAPSAATGAIGARRLHPPGSLHPRHGPRRRSARQAFRHSRHHRHRQVVHHGADPALDPAEEPGRAHGAARPAQRIRDRVRRMGRGHSASAICSCPIGF